MAEENQSKFHDTTDAPLVETQDRGLFGFGGKKHEEKPQEEVIISEFEKVKVSEPSETKVEESKVEEGEKKHSSLLEKFHRSDSSSSSSSDEEEVEGEEKKKKKKDKKGLKEKVKEKICGENEPVKHFEDTTVPVEKCDAEPVVHHDAAAAASIPEEKKGFLEKIKDKLPGQHKKPEEVIVSSEEVTATEVVTHDVEAKEKKGILEKIKEKLPGYHPKTEEEKKDDTAAH